MISRSPSYQSRDAMIQRRFAVKIGVCRGIGVCAVFQEEAYPGRAFYCLAPPPIVTASCGSGSSAVAPRIGVRRLAFEV